MRAKVDQIITSIKEFSPNSKLNEAFLGNILSFIHEKISFLFSKIIINQNITYIHIFTKKSV